nr:STAS domain-containing protein [Actinoplanes auranticolor]
MPRTSRTAVLICDQCGSEETTPEMTRDNDVVWPLIASHGWTGSPFATGAHRCPRCSITVARPADTVRDAPAPAHGASYDIREHDDAVVITPLTDVDAGLAEVLRDGLMAAAGRYAHVVVDLRAVHFIDSSGLGLLVRARQEARSHGGTVSLAAPSRFVLTVLHTMRLDVAFPHFPDQETALRHIRTAGAQAP